MKRKLFSRRGILLSALFFIVVFSFSVITLGQGNGFFLRGKLTPPLSWSGGHSEKVLFLTGGEMIGVPDFQQPYIDAQGKLYGHVWLGTA